MSKILYLNCYNKQRRRGKHMLEIVIADPVEMLSDIRQAVSDLQSCVGYDMNDKIREQCNKMNRAIESIRFEFKKLGYYDN